VDPFQGRKTARDTGRETSKQEQLWLPWSPLYQLPIVVLRASLDLERGFRRSRQQKEGERLDIQERNA
jgi:hypothetical protein